MLAEVKKCVEAHDIKGLRYIFLDCLDVDPTFEKYKEDYEYCKSIEGLFDPHQPLNGISMDEKDWTANYWDLLKLDLMKNFSKTRFEHMIAVAKIVYANKIVRLLDERKKQQEKQTVRANHTNVNENEPTTSAKSLADEELEQEKRIAEKRRELEAENQRVAAEQAAQKARIEAARREATNRQNIAGGENGLKKAQGIVLIVIAVLVVLMLIVVLH